MRGKRAKALRKAVYGDKSLKQKREYDFSSGGATNKSTGLRAKYKLAKTVSKGLRLADIIE